MPVVRDVMTHDPCMVEPSTTLLDVVSLLKTTHCRQLPVIDDDDQIVGIVTDRDIRLALNSPLTLHERHDDIDLLHTVTAEACMTPDPKTISPDADIQEAVSLLIQHKFGALPVTEGRSVVGIITTIDLLKYLNDLLASAQP